MEELIHLVKEGEWKLVLDMKSTGRIEIIEVIIWEWGRVFINYSKIYNFEIFTADPVFSKLMSDPERVIFVDGLENGRKWCKSA